MKRKLLLKVASKSGIMPWYGWRDTIDVEHRYWVEVPVETPPDAGENATTEMMIETEIKEVVVADPTVADLPGKDGWTWKDASAAEWEAAYVAATEKLWKPSTGATADEAKIELEYMREHIWRLPDDVLAALEAAK
jgi:nucleoside 2-deoxyribosyltransferase